MKKHLVAAWKRATGRDVPRRDLLIWPDDVFLVSYPKSGNTWVRFLIANLLFPNETVSFANLSQLLPGPFETTKRDFERVPRPRVIKSHDCFDPRYPRVIYIVRDPRDVVVSQYHYHRKCKKIEDGYPMEQFVDRFLAGDTSPHGSWSESVTTWLTSRYNDPRFLLLRYEDVTADPKCEVGRIAGFLNISADSERVSQCVERSAADRMRKLEKLQSDKTALTRDSRKDLSFVRSAKSGGWKRDLPEALIERIEMKLGHIMKFLNYPLTTRQASSSESLFSELMVRGSAE